MSPRKKEPYVGELLFLGTRPSRGSAQVYTRQRDVDALLTQLADLLDAGCGLAVAVDLKWREGCGPEGDPATAAFLDLWKELAPADQTLGLLLMRESGKGPHEVGESLLAARRLGEAVGHRVRSYAADRGLDPDQWHIEYDIHLGTFVGRHGEFLDPKLAEEEARLAIREEAEKLVSRRAT